MDKEKELDEILGISVEEHPQPSGYYGNASTPEGYPQPTGYYGNPPAHMRRPSTIGDNGAETVLAIVAYAILIVGVVVSISLGVQVGSHGFDNDALGFAIGIGGSILSIITWASCMVIVNISNNVRQIKHDLRNK